MIRITETVFLSEDELRFDFVRSGGPGGQNVNKVSSAVVLRFDAAHSPGLPEPVKQRLRRMAGSRMTSGGVIVIRAQRFRSQERNREDAEDRLRALLMRACAEPRRRVRTVKPVSAQRERLDNKKKASVKKRWRSAVRGEEP
jgi:ribosome-associated protein